jgi:hypothetical protein
MSTKDFGFEVRWTDRGWQVDLPHECNRWTIAGDVNYGEGVTKDDAIASLEQFISEARQALEALKDG